MRLFKRAFLGTISFCILLVGSVGAQTEETIKICGADSMYGRISGLCKGFAKDHPQCLINVTKDSLVNEGMQDLINSKAEIAMASRKATPQEMEAAKAKGVQLVEHLIGYGGIVIITDAGNSVGELSVDQVRRIFTGELANWKSVGGKDQPIAVFSVGEKHPGTVCFMEQDILGGAQICKEAKALPDFPTIMQTVAETPGSVAFTRIRDPFESQVGHSVKIKALKIKKDELSPPVNPSRSTVKDGSYPLKRPYYLYTTGAASKEVQSLVEFIASKGWGEQSLTYMWQ